MSGIGKGIASASIGRILQSKGFKVTALKIERSWIDKRICTQFNMKDISNLSTRFAAVITFTKKYELKEIMVRAAKNNIDPIR